MDTKRALLAAVVGAALIPAAGAASASTYELKFFDVDDVMSAYISNDDLTEELMFSRPFGHDYDYVDITSFVRDGLNTILLTLENGPSGYSYGYDFTIDGASYASGHCGIFNTYGCDADRYGTGEVWRTEIAFTASDVAPVPLPASMALLGSVLAAGGALAARKRRRAA
ncbi:hypothetical protein [Rubellimicrobium aerolatum]|uniref:VPLPA-CTERM sorting domain-containing protein n=1 Tax=Rubellimicrobium aerolatum TaxID=490979 RepID=A0ABW0SCP4_9RHOB|nr:hypothetical protein [Rubellimicrobium aerolatum]MBP1806593.1 hypothetical protein [Rubellimicrobium aerolatum]